MTQQLSVEPTGESHGHCECCGNESRTVWGYVHDSEKTIAAYFVRWTVGQSEHLPNLDFLIGTWGNDNVNDRVLSAWLFNPSQNSFMITDAAQRPAAGSTLCSHALSRDETLALPGVKAIAASCLDAVWRQDHRIADIRGLANDA
jgi:hypothetical protein